MAKKRESVLVLGAGNSPLQRLFVPGVHQNLDKGTTLSDNFERVVRLDIDPGCSPDILHDLEVFPWPVEEEFTEVHAYECLEHLGAMGDYHFFFNLWKEIWRVLKPGGLVCATTPYWKSVWAWQDPGHRRIYSQELLTYLDQKAYEAQIGQTAMTDYRRVFPPPYSFGLVGSMTTGTNPDTAGFQFVLRKEFYDAG